MAKSIMQTKKECYITHRTDNLHLHHIYFGSGYRKLSDKYGCTVWLTAEWHNASNHGVHFNRELDLKLKMECQRRFEEVYPDLDFRSVFGKNYL